MANLTVMTDFRSHWHRLPREVRLGVGYLFAGLPLGALWMAHAGDTPWQHAVRLVVLMAVVMGVSSVVRRVAARQGRPVAHPPVGKFLIAKGTLVLAAVAAGYVLDGRIANVDMWIGLGLVFTVAVGGPIVHPWLTAPTRPAAMTAA